MTTDSTTVSGSNKLWPAIAVVLVALIAGLILRAEGRLWSCACGYLKVWVGDTCSSSNSQQLFDPYSFTHVLHGFLFFWLVLLLFRRLGPSWQVVVAVTLEAAWEVFENTPFVINRYRTETAALGYNGDTIVNSFGDLTCALVGFLIARWLGWRRSLIVFLIIEAILIWWIRDSLLLEILMLIRPIGPIKAWQMCQ
jgi:hypothetical protein